MSSQPAVKPPTSRTSWPLIVLVGAAAWLVLGDLAAGYDFRKLRSRTAYRGERELAVEIDLPASAVEVAAGDSTVLCAVDVAYDADGITPQVDTLAHDQSVERVLIRALERGGDKWRFGEGEGQLPSFAVRLSPMARVALSLRLEGGRCALRLGGLALTELDVVQDGGALELTFDEPNRASLRRLSADVSGECRATGLGRAGIERLDFSGRMGQFDLGFGGPLERPLRARVAVSLGSLALAVPDTVGVLIRPPGGLLARFELPDGFRERGDGAYVNAAWDAGDERLEIEIEASAAAIEVRTTDGE